MFSSSHRFPLPLRSGILVLFALLLADLGAGAQTLKRWVKPDSIPLMKPRFRTTDTTFLIGCYAQPEKLLETTAKPVRTIDL